MIAFHERLTHSREGAAGRHPGDILTIPLEIEYVAKMPLGYVATFCCSGTALSVKWSPDVPDIRNPRVRRKFFETYKLERDSFIEMVATALGGKVATADLDGSVHISRPAVLQ